MTENAIAGAMLALRSAIKMNDESAAAEAALRLLERVIIDLHRIADAMEAKAGPLVRV